MDGRTWHAASAEAVFERLAKPRDALSDDEAAQRLDERGPNKISKGDATSPLRILLHQFTSPLIAGEIRRTERAPTSIQTRMLRFWSVISLGPLGAGAIVFLIGLYRRPDRRTDTVP